MATTLLQKIIADQKISSGEMYDFAKTIIDGTVDQIQLGALLAVLAHKGETAEEITGLVKALQEGALHLDFPYPVLDTCGSGGDSKHTFNISTTAAFVCAGAGANVAKHGNRSYSSKSGSADVLEALGISITLTPEQVKKTIDETGIGFLFAPNFHPAMKHVLPVRKALGIRTIFNLIGPLISPAGSKHQVIGVPNKKTAELFLDVLPNLGAEHVLLVCGDDGMDEVSVCSPSSIWEYSNRNISSKHHIFNPLDFGIEYTKIESLQVDSPSESAGVLKGILEGSITDARRDVVIVNAMAGLVAFNLASSWEEGIAQAKESLDSGEALRKLNALRDYRVLR